MARRDDKEGQKAYHAEYYQKHKQEWVDGRHRKGGKYWEKKFARDSRHRQLITAVKVLYGCSNPNCPVKGTQLPHYCFDFHHIDPKQKDFSVASMPSCKKATIAKEINKCIVLCVVCHKQAHFGDLDVSEFKTCRVDERLVIENLA